MTRSRRNLAENPASLSWLVDLPTLDPLKRTDATWVNAGRFSTKEGAVEFIRRHIDPNCDDEGHVCLIVPNLKELRREA